MGDSNGRPDVTAACTACGQPLMPLSYERPETDQAANRPNLKCTGCGKRYRWVDNAGWVAVDSP